MPDRGQNMSFASVKLFDRVCRLKWGSSRKNLVPPEIALISSKLYLVCHSFTFQEKGCRSREGKWGNCPSLTLQNYGKKIVQLTKGISNMKHAWKSQCFCWTVLKTCPPMSIPSLKLVLPLSGPINDLLSPTLWFTPMPLMKETNKCKEYFIVIQAIDMNIFII